MKITGKPPDTDIDFTICMIPIIRKYMLATLENCISKLRGKKLYIVYFEVFIVLSHTSLSGTFIRMDRFGIEV